MNGSGLTSDILNVLFYLFIMLLIAFVVSKNFRRCLLNLILPKSWAKQVDLFFNNYIFACETTETPKAVTATPSTAEANKEKFTSDNKKKIVFTAYTADWCPHCVSFKRDSLGQLKSYFRNHETIEIKNMDCTNDTTGRIKTKNGNSLQGYPTLVINISKCNDRSEEVYDGPRDAGSIIKYLQSL
jgi:thiol:disulfide interchange protein